MSKLVTSDNLKAYHAELAEHIKLLQRNTAYVLNDIVNYDGMTLKCTTAGTTNTTKPNISSLSVGSTYTDGTCVWTRIDPDKRGIDYWASSTTYSLNDQVVNDNKIYKCSTAHTSTSTFDDTKWTEISVSSSGGGLDYWATSTSYSVDDIVVYNNQIWRCTTAHTSSSTFDSTKFTEISASGAGGISVWESNTQYAVNDVVIDSNLIWQCATAHTSTTTFDESKWVCISGGEISNGLEIVPLWEGEFSFSNNTNGSAPTSSTPTIELSESVSNFQYLYVTAKTNDDNNSSVIVNTDSITDYGNKYIRIGVFGNNNYFVTAEIGLVDDKNVYIKWKDNSGWSEGYITSVQGIRKAKPIVSSGMKYETLWEGEAGNLSGAGSATITLSESLMRYQKFGVQVMCDMGNYTRYYYREFNTSSFISWLSNTTSGDEKFSLCWGYSNTDDFVDFNYTSTDIQLMFNCNKSIITKIIGISEGVVVPTGVQAARVTLWEGSYGSEGSYVELSDSITNYDQLIFTINGGVYSTEDNYVDNIINIDDNTYNKVSFRLFCGWQDEGASFNIKFTDATHFTIVHKNASSWATGSAITRVVGIKYIQPDSYSTEEKLIGTWIDGKPLYRKVFENPTNGMNTGLSGCNALKLFGQYVANAYNNTAMTCENMYFNEQSGTIGFVDTSISLKYIVIEYTKN